MQLSFSNKQYSQISFFALVGKKLFKSSIRGSSQHKNEVGLIRKETGILITVNFFFDLIKIYVVQGVAQTLTTSYYKIKDQI